MERLVRLSVIIPVYNVEKFLLKCLKSIEPIIDLGHEVIIVNDGSSDNSKLIIKSFIEEHPSVKYIFQANLGLSGARNTGLQAATGEYIWFIDSDDYIEEKETRKLIDNINNSDSDIIVFGRVEEYQSYNISIPINKTYKEYPTGCDYFLSAIRDSTFRTNVWDKVFKKTLIDSHQLKFEEGLLYEDMFFCLQAFMYAKTITVLPCFPYHYVKYNNNSITNLVRTKDLDVIEFVCRAYYFMEENSFSITVDTKEFQMLIFNWVSSCIMNKYAYLSLKEPEAKYIFDKVRNNVYFKYTLSYCSRKNVGIRRKVFANLLICSPILYKIILHIALTAKNFRIKYFK